MQGQLDPPILVAQAIKPAFNISTPLFVCDDLSIKKSWGTSCSYSQTQGLGLNPKLRRLYGTEKSNLFPPFK